MFIGIGIGVALWQTGNKAAWWGLLPFGIGLAYLVSSRLRAAEWQPPASGASDPNFR
jgi:hypothetical protein